MGKDVRSKMSSEGSCRRALVVIAAAAVSFAVAVPAQGATCGGTRLVPFQARLVDGAGQPLPDGVKKVTFGIYDAETGGVPCWTEVHQTASIIGGQINVLLGSLTSLDDPDCSNQGLKDTDGVSFAGTTVGTGPCQAAGARYLGIKVGEGDEMVPRQQLVPAFHASTADEAMSARSAENAANASKLGGLDPSFYVSVSVPVGGVIMWWGKIQDIPNNFEVCDGTAPATPGSTLGGTKPDLRDRFVKGALAGVTDVRTAVVGGRNTYSLTVDQLPLHTHSLVGLSTGNAGTHNHALTAVGRWGDQYAFDEGGFSSEDGRQGSHTFTTSDSGGHTHTVTGSIGNTGTGAQIDNRPAFLSLFYIIRVK